MKSIDKNKFTKRLAGYSALAATLLAISPDADAQCVPLGGSLPVDIDGDGVTDITINNVTSTFFTSTGTATAYYAVGPYVSGPGPYTIVTTAPQYTSPGSCGPLINIGDGAWTLNLSTYYINFQYVYNVQAAFTFIYYNLNSIVASAGNQVVGLSNGSSVCSGIAAAGVSSTFGGFCYQGSYGSVVNVFTSYLYYFGNALPAIDSEPVSNPAGCTNGGLPIATFTLYIPPFVAGPYSGGSQIAGPSSNVLPIGPACAALPAIGVEFQSAANGGTMYGWAQLSIGADGLLCVDATGFNGCSVEEVAAAGGAAGVDECIAVGDASTNLANEACMVAGVCAITDAGLVVGACDTGADPEDATDDTFTFTLNPTGTDLGGTYSVSGDVTMAAVAYGAATTFDNGAAGYPIGTNLTITITDDVTGAACTLDVAVTSPGDCSGTTTDIPTLSQWGLITLMLALMSYGAIAMSNFGELAAILRRKEEE